MQTKNEKTLLRRKMRSMRGEIIDRAEKSAAICNHILEMEEYQSAACVMLYMPIGSEADVMPAIEAAVRQGKRVCLPVCRENGRMDAVEYTGSDCLKVSAYGIREPEGRIVPPQEIELILCPGLAFDARGMRLGYGKGYYDRYLEKVHAFWAGICYTECIVENVPADVHDVPMKALVTQTGVMRMGGK